MESPNCDTSLGLYENKEISNNIKKILKAWNLTIPSYLLLKILATSGERGLTIAKIRESLPKPPHTISKMVGNLEYMGCVKGRRQNKDDRQIVIYTISPEGVGHLSNVMKDLEQYLNEIKGVNSGMSL